MSDRTDALRPLWQMTGTRRTTGEAIADAAAFGVLVEPVCDLTIGVAAGFWTDYKPGRLVTNDASPMVAADHHVDVEMDMLPYEAGHFGTAAFDPPYRMSGTSSTSGQAGAMNDRYGVDRYRSKAEIWSLYEGGVLEAVRLANRFVIVKCADQTSSGQYQDQSHHVRQVAYDAGCRLEFVLYVVAIPRAQPAGRGVKRPACNVSQLMVFERRS